MSLITSTDPTEALKILSEAKEIGDCIRITQQDFGTKEAKIYRFKVAFPNGFKGKSVAAWYSAEWQSDGLYMPSRDFANYICNINSGRGGQNISYAVDRIKVKEL